MRFASRRCGACLYGASGLSIATYAAAEANLLIALLALPLWAASWRSVTGEEGPRVNRAVSMVVAVGLTAVLALGLLASPDQFIVFFSRYLIGLTLLKLYDQRNTRDRAIVLATSAATVIGATLTNATLEVGLFGVAFVVAMMGATMWLQLQGAERVREAAARGVGGAAEAGRGIDGRVVRFGSALCVIASAIMLVVFIAMPRGFGDMGGAGALDGSTAGSISGFSPEVRLDEPGRIRSSHRSVLRVRLAYENGSPVLGRMDRVYLRGAVLDRYEDDRWIASEPPTEPAPVRARPSAMTPLNPDAETVGPGLLQEFEVIGSPSDERMLTVLNPVGVRAERRTTVLFEPTTGELRAEDETPGAYAVISRPQEPSAFASPPQPPAFREGRVRELAEGLLASRDIERDPGSRHSPRDEQIARIFEQHLRGRCAYTTVSPEVPPGSDPVEAFLYDLRAGHCEFFASALAAMCRSVGIEARVVTGYVASEEQADGSLLVRESHAHAWVEAHIEPGQWMTFDPSPPAGVAASHTPPTGLLAAARRGWWWLEDVWARRVISYDDRAQRALLGERLTSLVTSTGGGLRWSADGAVRVALIALLRGVVAFAVTVALGYGLVALVRWINAEPAASDAGGGGSVAAARTARLLAAATRALRRAGLRRASHEPPLAFARRLEVFDGEIASAMSALASIHYGVRYGGQELGTASLARAQEAVETVRRRVAEGGDEGRRR